MPTRVYRYGLLPPTVAAETVDEQIRRAHRYQNVLIEIERERRARAREVQSSHGTMAAHEECIRQREEAWISHRAALAARRSAERERNTTPEEREAGAKILAALREARAAARAARAAVREDPAVRLGLSEAGAAAAQRQREARAACGVYWGTYLLIEQAVDASRRSPTEPRFRRWTGEGAVAAQIQHGISVADATACEDQRLRIDLTPVPVPGRGGRPRPRLKLRVGSDGRAPVWAEWPLIYHRPLPDRAVIKWAKVVRRRIAAHDQWSLHLTVDIPEPEGTNGMRAVAVDLGWRREAGALRAGEWCDEAGRGGEIMLDSRVRDGLRKAEDLRSIRDQHMNRLRTVLAACRDVVPEGHRERMQWLPQWRSPGRFAALALWWREHRWTGDLALYTYIEEWRRKDKHLWEWEANNRRRSLLLRRERYRVFAADLACRYGTLIIERLDLRALSRIPDPVAEPGRESNPRARAQRVDTAPSELRSALESAFRARGGVVVTVPPTGPASALVAAYRERVGVESKPGSVRGSRFSRMRGAKGASGAE